MPTIFDYGWSKAQMIAARARREKAARKKAEAWEHMKRQFAAKRGYA